MDIEAREKVGKLIKEITESGEWTLDSAKLKSIKSICKRSDNNVESAFEWWLAQLKKEHAQIRYSCVQLAEELFKRSHKFRSLLSDDFPLFISLTVGIHDKKLPPPASVAGKLKIYALALIKDWYLKFGDKYRPLVIGYDYLEHNGILTSYGERSLDSIHAQDLGRAQRETRMQAIYERRFGEVKEQFQQQRDLIEDNLKTMQGCFEILVPRNDENGIDFDALIKGDFASASEQRAEEYKESLISHGLASNRYKITIDLSENPIMDQVQESEENEVLYEQLREGYKLLKTKHQNQINEWINSLTRIEPSDKKGKDILLKQLIDIKSKMDEAIRKSDLLGIPAQVEKAQEEAYDEFLEELFEDIEIPESSSLAKKPKLSATREEEFSSRKLPPAQRIFPLAYEPAMEEDVTYNRARVFYDPPAENDNDKSEPSSEEKTSLLEKAKQDDDNKEGKGKGKARQQGPSREELLKIAPVVEWGEDLFYWDKNSVQFNQSGLERAHRFMGVGEGTNEIPQHVLENLRKRTMYYRPQMPQNLKACRAPLHNGQLCPRRDLVTCPFHGRIIPRDEFGRPQQQQGEEEGNASSSNEAQRQERPLLTTAAPSGNLWEELEADVMQQVGQERIDPNKRGRKRKQRPQSNLIDVRKKKETTMSRLQKRVDDPKTRRLVQEAADYEQTMRARNKRANVW